MAGTDALALPHASIDDDAIETAESLGEVTEHPEHLWMVVDVQRLDLDSHAECLRQFVRQFEQPLGPSGAQGQTVATSGELPCHTGAQTGTGAGDQYDLGWFLHIPLCICRVTPNHFHARLLLLQPISCRQRQ